jgi:hypothetical protein
LFRAWTQRPLCLRIREWQRPRVKSGSAENEQASKQRIVQEKRIAQFIAARYRIVQGLDSAAALVTSHGVVAAAAEERFCRAERREPASFHREQANPGFRRAGLPLSPYSAIWCWSPLESNRLVV